MKIMNVQLTIDVNNAQHVAALKQLMDALAEDQQKAIEKAVKEPIKKATASKTKVEPLPVAEEQATEEDDLLGVEESEEAITKSTLMQLTSKKIQASSDNRIVITEKIKTYGVKNVSSIPESEYRDYFNFVNGLNG